MRSELSLDLSSPSTLPLEARITEFKQDPKNVDEMRFFIDEILKSAEDQANLKLKEKSVKEPSARDGNNVFANRLANIKRGRMVTRARGMVLRLFDAICNCTNSGPVSTQINPTTPRS